MTKCNTKHNRFIAVRLASCGFFFGMPATPLVASAGGKILTLEDALSKARQTHPRIHASRAEIEAAEAQVKEAYSGYLPRLDTYVRYRRTTGNRLPAPWTAGLVQSTSAEQDNRLDVVLEEEERTDGLKSK